MPGHLPLRLAALLVCLAHVAFAETRLSLMPMVGHTPDGWGTGGTIELEIDWPFKYPVVLGFQGLVPNRQESDDVTDMAHKASIYSGTLMGLRFRKPEFHGFFCGIGGIGHLGLTDSPFIGINPEIGYTKKLGDRFNIETVGRYYVTTRLPDGGNQFAIVGVALSIKLY